MLDKLKEVNKVITEGMNTVEVGMGATMYVGSDSYPYTVIKIKSPTRLIVQEDTCERIDKNYANGSQDYLYKANPEGKTQELIKTKYGWKIIGSKIYFALGKRRAYYDYSF